MTRRAPGAAPIWCVGPGVIVKSRLHHARAKSCRDHKCASIGIISFISGTDKKTLNTLPGHDPGKYGFRFDGGIYRLPRDSYINSLVATGIERDDIRLDGHPNFEPTRYRSGVEAGR
jgi:hypothetical protein